MSVTSDGPGQDRRSHDNDDADNGATVDIDHPDNSGGVSIPLHGEAADTSDIDLHPEEHEEHPAEPAKPEPAAESDPKPKPKHKPVHEPEHTDAEASHDKHEADSKPEHEPEPEP